MVSYTGINNCNGNRDIKPNNFQKTDMIAFRFPYILLFYLVFLFSLIIWINIDKKRKKKVWSKIDPVLKNKLFSRLDTNLLKWKNRLTIIGLIFLIFSKLNFFSEFGSWIPVPNTAISILPNF